MIRRPPSLTERRTDFPWIKQAERDRPAGQFAGSAAERGLPAVGNVSGLDNLGALTVALPGKTARLIAVAVNVSKRGYDASLIVTLTGSTVRKH